MTYNSRFYQDYLEKLQGFKQVNWVKNYLDLKSRPNFWTILEYGQIASSRQRSSHEIRYSKMIRWLFDANENHNLGNVFATKLIKRIDNQSNYQLDLAKNKQIKAIAESLEDIDIFYSDLNQEVCLAIELKQFTTEHESTGFDSQLDKYEEAVKSYINKKGKNIKPFYVYLTPLKEQPTNPNWYAVGYQELIEIITEVNDEYLVNSSDIYAADIIKIITDFKDDLQRSMDVLQKDTSYVTKNFSKEELDFTILLNQEIMGEEETEHMNKLKALAGDSETDLEELVFLINEYIYNQDHTPNDGVRLLIRKLYQYLAEEPKVDLNLDRKYRKEERFAKIKPEIIRQYNLNFSKIELTGGKGQGIHLLTEDESRSIYFSGDSKGRFPNTRLQLLAYSDRTDRGKKPVLTMSDKLSGGLYTADYNLVENDQIYRNLSKDEVEIKSIADLIKNDLFEAIKDLNTHLN
ncbi:MAG: PD-(D/E)XK nuclease family protein [Clostridiaceae bacterium]|nr:PD-(D/E)XK nuclease family protein [Clostridiaceae bacterium]